MIHRLRIVWHVIRGRPLVYRTTFRGEVNFDRLNRNLLIAENVFRGREDETLPVSLLPGTYKYNLSNLTPIK